MPSAAPAVPDVDLSLTLSTASGEARTVDLTTRAVVVATVPTPRFGREAEVIAGVAAAVEAGADVVEVPAESKLLGPAVRVSDVPVAAMVTTRDTARRAIAAGAALLLVPRDVVATVLASDDSDDDASRDGGGTTLRRGDVDRGDLGSGYDVDRGNIDHGDVDRGNDRAAIDLGSDHGDVDWGNDRGTAVRRGDVPPSSAWTVATVVESAAAGRDAVAEQPKRPVLLDATRLAGADAVSEESLALAVGVRLIRTTDVRRTRRVVEVMAHLLAARR